jgi:hypothetical protein
MPENTLIMHELMRTYHEMSIRHPTQSKSAEYIKQALSFIRTAVGIEPANTNFRTLLSGTCVLIVSNYSLELEVIVPKVLWWSDFKLTPLLELVRPLLRIPVISADPMNAIVICGSSDKRVRVMQLSR